jgi:predicted N-acyltransferase
VPAASVSVHGAIAEIPAPEWDALVAHERDAASPFVRHAFRSPVSRC